MGGISQQINELLDNWSNNSELYHSGIFLGEQKVISNIKKEQ